MNLTKFSYKFSKRGIMKELSFLSFNSSYKLVFDGSIPDKKLKLQNDPQKRFFITNSLKSILAKKLGKSYLQK